MTETARRWPSSTRIAQLYGDIVLREIPELTSYENMLKDALEIAHEEIGYAQERKIARLTEALKDAITEGRVTNIEAIKSGFKDIYNIDVLAQYDEEGEPISG